MTNFKEFWRIVQTFHIFVIFVQSYFLDVKNFTVYDGPNNSLFGYSVALLNNSDGLWILAGAPEGEDIFQPWVRQPGALYKCLYPAGKERQCQQVNVDSSGNSEETVLYHRRKIRFHSDKDHQWLGVSLDVDPENQSSVLICAHRWKDSYLSLHLNGINHMNGMCYELDASLSKTARKIPALTIRERLVNRQRYAEFSMGGLGMSAIYSGVSGYIIMGAPGLNDWSGGVVLERNGSNKDDIHYIEPPRRTNQDSQIGSSLAVGNFLFRTVKSLALGAPRAGKVLFYEWMDTNREPVHIIENEQIGIGFGASLLTYRIPNDYLDDIIIGAPYFTSNSMENEGRVYVFKSRGILGFGLDTTLKGVPFAHAQFGASIGNLGDLNNDGFNDVAIGAPYEDNGSGGIYIFNGHKSGIWPTYTQHIKSSDLHQSIKGFGISFSRPSKINDGRKTVVVVGCHRSSQAVVLQSSTMLNIQPSIKRTKISAMCEHCVPFQICFHVETKQDNILSNVFLNFTATIKQDAALKFGPLDKSKTDEFLSTMKDSVSLTLNNISCSEQYFITVKDCCLGDDEIQIMITFELSNVTASVVINKFQGKLDRPVLTSSFPYKFRYKDFCGISRRCNTALNVSLLWEKLENGRHLIIEPGRLSLLVTLSNPGLSLNNIILYQVFPREMFFLQAINTNSNRTLSCTIERKEQNKVLECLVGRIEGKEHVVLRLEYIIQEPKSYMSNVTVQSTVTTKIVPIDGMRVYQNYTVQTVRHIYANVKRYSRPSNFLLINRQSVFENSFSHVFYLSLTDPDDVENVYFLVPGFQKELSSSEVVIQHGKSNMKCTWGNFTQKLIDFEYFKDVKICKYIHCDLLSCELTPQSRLIVVKALFHFTLNLQHWKSINKIMEQEYSSQMCYKSRFAILGENPICRRVTTIMKDVYRAELDGRVHYWFFTLAVFTGFIILVVISCFLYKCGFFKRKARQELKLKIETQKLSTVHLLPTETSASEEADNETFVLTPFPSGSDDTQVMTPPPCYMEVMQRVSNSSTECFFIYDEEDGYLQPVF